MNVRVDHIVLVHGDLKKAAQIVSQVTGLEVRGGGRHDAVGTSNLIIPMGETYLELATVNDPVAAAQHPFGRLVSAALEHDRALAAWAVAGTVGDDAVPLSRAGVSVRLVGCDQAIIRPDLPFRLERPGGQAFPGATSEPRRLREIHLRGPEEPGGLSNGPTELVTTRGPAALHSFALDDADGHELSVTNDIWSTL
ncbi:VOC family protein [Rhodococcus erythropolis]|uniref:VOC family protein n=1 Tax=Rhodococcus erythropolis TaxID=1833 RepID=UPI00038DCDCF|nr:VOC family protein [Rhodococcus erythropolis]AGT95434.1 hypothetical protein O5Y_28085 [Rhodococcus erythropolis CCM2595]MDF2467931.1 hypothetical protein [Rhodococcus erythropolis]OFV77336.1 hypothetical protein RERY_20170 [Rhodococcus erythropolis]SUE10190.1 Uncharacterised protein [Rhodococcus erythropolis]